MSAFAAITSPDGRTGYLITDTAAVHGESLQLIGYVAKARTLPHARTVFSVRATHLMLEFAEMVVGRFASFDEICLMAPDLLRTGYPAMVEKHGPQPVEIGVLGFSAIGNRMRIALITSARNFQIDKCADLFAPMVGLPEPNANDPAAYLLECIERQRLACRKSYEDPYSLVGGAAVLTTLTEHTIEQRVLKRWPDKIGEKIRAA